MDIVYIVVIAAFVVATGAFAAACNKLGDRK